LEIRREQRGVCQGEKELHSRRKGRMNIKQDNGGNVYGETGSKKSPLDSAFQSTMPRREGIDMSASIGGKGKKKQWEFRVPGTWAKKKKKLKKKKMALMRLNKKWV